MVGRQNIRMRRRIEEKIRRELEQTRERLELYLAREKEMLSRSGVQIYGIGSRNLQRYNTSLAAIQEEIDRLRKRIDELEGELEGNSPRRAVGVVPRDW